jgi:hypothetical protein
MATTEDLRAVLRAREVHAGDIDTVLDRLAAGPKRSRGRLVPALAAAAAVVVAATVAVTAVTISGGSNGRGAGSLATGDLSARHLDFSITTDTGVVPWQFTATPAEQWVQLTYKKMWLQLLVFSPGDTEATPRTLQRVLHGGSVGDQVPGLEFVSVAGHPGYVGLLVNNPGGVPATASPEDRPGNALAWQYAAGAWAILQPQGAHPTTTELLDIAGAVDFSRTTSLRSAIELSARPTGMKLVAQEQTYSRDPWRTVVTYGTPSDDQEISVSAQGLQPGPTAWPNTVPVTVGNREGRWDAKQLDLKIFDTDRSIQLDVFAERGSMTLDQAIAVAKTITVTADPARPETWFAANKALP